MNGIAATFTSRLSVRAPFRLPFCSMPANNMVDLGSLDDLDMEEGAAHQLYESFGNFAAHLQGVLPKRVKRDHPSPPTSVGSNGQSQLTKALVTMLLRHEIQLNDQRRQDTWIFFMAQGQKSLMELMIQQAALWQSQESKAQPLRQRLLMQMIETMMTRLTQLMQAQKTDTLRKTAYDQKLLLPDDTMPYLQWDNRQQQLLLNSKRKPIPMEKVQSHLQEFQQYATEVERIVRFQGLKANPQTKVATWRLQLRTKDDHFHELMEILSGLALWQLGAATMRPHSQSMSGLARHIMSLTGNSNHSSNGGKGSSGKGKSKQHSKGT